MKTEGSRSADLHSQEHPYLVPIYPASRGFSPSLNRNLNWYYAPWLEPDFTIFDLSPPHYLRIKRPMPR